MGRARNEENKSLPKGMAEKNGRYYFVTTTKPRVWIPLGRLLNPALRHYHELSQQKTGELTRPTLSPRKRRTIGKRSMKPGESTNKSITEEAKTLLSRTRINAASRSIPMYLSLEDVIMLLKRADGRCEVTQIEFDFGWGSKNWKSRPWVPSIDRIHNGKGYAVSNCRIVCHAVNRAMGEWSMEIFDRLCVGYASTKENSRRTGDLVEE